MLDPAYKTVLLMWAKDLVETAIVTVLAWPVARRLVKKFFADLACPHCGRKRVDQVAAEIAATPADALFESWFRNWDTTRDPEIERLCRAAWHASRSFGVN